MIRTWLALEAFLLVSGALLLGSSAGVVGFSAWHARADRIAMERALGAQPAVASAPAMSLLPLERLSFTPADAGSSGICPVQADAPEEAPDTREWSAARVRHFEHSREEADGERLGLLEIPSVDLSVVVLEGTSEWALNRGVGRIRGTATPDRRGNLGIAGHRDGYFRALRHIKSGDEIRLRAPGLDRTYRVEWIRIVKPSDVSVLKPTDAHTLTLVTCYPFWFIGSAPKRFIVRAKAAPIESRRR